MPNGLLKSILKDAVEDGLIATNPCRVRAGGQKTRTGEIEVLSVEQLTNYLNVLPEARRVPLLLAGWCWLRSGEVRGLRVRDSTWTPAWCTSGRRWSGWPDSC